MKYTFSALAILTILFTSSCASFRKSSEEGGSCHQSKGAESCGCHKAGEKCDCGSDCTCGKK